MKIDFVKFSRPDGCATAVDIDLQVADLEPLVRELRAAKWSFEIEILSTGEVSADVCDEEGQLAIELCDNGPGVGAMVERLIRSAHREWCTRGRPQAVGDRYAAHHRRMHLP